MSFIIKNYWKYFKREYYKSYITQKKIRQLSLSEIKKIQWKRLKDLLNYAYNNNDFYKDYFESINLNPDLIKIPSDMSKLPITEKKDYIKNFNKIITKNIKKDDYAVATTSGSTGEPFQHYVDIYRGEVIEEMAFFLNMEANGIKSFEKYNQLRIHFHPPNEIKDFKQKRKKRFLHNIKYYFFPDVIGIKSCTINPENCKDILRIIKENNIQIINGFPSAILNMARLFSQLDMNGVHMKGIITFGESLFNQQRTFISKVFNCPVFMDYGSSECMRMGFECKRQNGFHMDIYNYYFDYLKGENDNKEADLVATNLNNYVFPFIRYKTNDKIVLCDKTCNCGINLPLIKNVIGRSNDVIITHDGNLLSSATFSGYFEEVEKRIPAIRQFQIIKKRNDEMIVKIVPTEKYNDKIMLIIHNELAQIMGKSTKITIIPVEFIDPEPSGKTKVLIIE